MNLAHPKVHRAWSDWSESEALHIILPYNNPCRWRTRREYFQDTERHLSGSPNVVLHRVELAYGDRPFEVTGDDPNDLQLRTSCELWHKENLINLGMRSLPPDYKYAGYVDADFHFTRRDWALEAVHLLQRNSFVQLFSSYADLSAGSSTSASGHRPYRMNSSFAWNYLHQQDFLQNKLKAPAGKQESAGRRQTSDVFPFGFAPGATGGAWAWRRDGFDAIGGLLDICVLGSGDEHTAMGLIGAQNVAMEMRSSGESYVGAVARWQRHAGQALAANRHLTPVGCVDNFALHYFHGSKLRRGYSDRRLLLKKHAFDPSTDIIRDWQGVWQWAGNKPGLRDDIRAYFDSRDEDNPAFVSERSLI